jgi:hypothetical protein
MPAKGTRTGATLTCTHCGTPFYVQPARLKLGVATTCSLACRSATILARRPLRTCEQCGADFAPRPSSGNRMCSPKCRNAALILPMADRFWPKVTKGDDCWEWSRKRDRRGYGRFATTSSRYVSAHRMAWELTHGEIPKGLSVLHRCDNPPCVRPDHLFLGTPADNVADMLAKGRESRGKQHGAAIKNPRRGSDKPEAILTDDQVRAIRAAFTGKRGELAALARRYGIRPSHAWKIVHRTIWAHIA